MSGIKYLRKNNLRWIGILIVAIGLYAGYMAEQSRSPNFVYFLSIIFIGAGISWLSKKSLYRLWIEKNILYWGGIQGKNINNGKIDIVKIVKIELKRNYRGRGKAGVQWNEIFIKTQSEEYMLPENLNFGSADNPRFGDVLEALRKINPTIEYEEFVIKDY